MHFKNVYNNIHKYKTLHVVSELDAKEKLSRFLPSFQYCLVICFVAPHFAHVTINPVQCIKIDRTANQKGCIFLILRTLNTYFVAVVTRNI